MKTTGRTLCRTDVLTDILKALNQYMNNTFGLSVLSFSSSSFSLLYSILCPVVSTVLSFQDGYVLPSLSKFISSSSCFAMKPKAPWCWKIYQRLPPKWSSDMAKCSIHRAQGPWDIKYICIHIYIYIHMYIYIYTYMLAAYLLYICISYICMYYKKIYI